MKIRITEKARAEVLDVLADALESLGWWHRFFATHTWEKRNAALFIYCIYCEHMKPSGAILQAISRAKKVLSLQNREWWELP